MFKLQPLPLRIGLLCSLSCAAFLVFERADGEEPAKRDPEGPVNYRVSPIGRVEKEGEKLRIVLDKKYQSGLLGLDGFSHVYVIWWFHDNDTAEKRATLQVNPRRDPKNPLTGVFACRAPVRPNLIALTLCKIVSVKDNVVEIEGIDANPGSPVLDLKPYNPHRESIPAAKVPAWVPKE